MPEKPSWLNIKNRYVFINLFVYGLIIILLVLFRHELYWAQKTLCGYLWTNNFDPPADILLLKEAETYLGPNGDLKDAEQLLIKAIQIDPYSRANYYLGNCYADQNKFDDALKYYERFRKIDPSFWRIYLNSIQLLKIKRDIDTLEVLLKEGINFYKKRVELYQPRLDETVEKRFNDKALETYLISTEVLKRLEEELERVQIINQNKNDINH
jgi:tetratricopeptide (TPR) repeat protein